MSKYLSFSQVKQLRTCGEAYRLARVERWPRRPSAPAVAGTIVHTCTEAIDWLLLEHPDVTREQLIECGLRNMVDVANDVITSECNEDFPTPDDWKRFGRKTKEKPNAEDIYWFLKVGIPNSIVAYVDWRLAHPELTLDVIPNFGPAIEVPFLYRLNDGSAEGQLIHGWIDRVFQNYGEGHYPFDLKSGLKPKTDEQVGLYGAALKAGLGWQPTYGYYLYGLKSGKAKMTPPLNIQHWTDDKLGMVYLPATLQISSGIFIPNPGEACFTCDVSHACSYHQAVI